MSLAVLERAPSRNATEQPKSARSSSRAMSLLTLTWLAALVVGMALVVYGLGPLFEQRDQRKLMHTFRADVSRAANEATGLQGVTVPTTAVDPGKPVAILEIGPLKLQQVVVEGVRASQTRHGPGHVPGTAGLGQPGNSVLVGRRAAFGHSFGSLGRVRVSDTIVATTTQGQSVYRVRSVHHVKLTRREIDSFYGPSKDDRITLVTSSSLSPWNKMSATVIVARMDGTPFAPTPQGGRTGSETGTHGDSGAAAAAVIALFVYGLAMAASIVLYRVLKPRTAYLLTLAPVVALTITAAETLSRALPAWT